MIPPVVVGSRICRLVSPVESLLEVEEWAGEWWEPSSITMTTVALAPLARSEVLVAAGVPRADQLGEGRRLSNKELQEMLLVRRPPRDTVS